MPARADTSLTSQQVCEDLSAPEASAALLGLIERATPAPTSAKSLDDYLADGSSAPVADSCEISKAFIHANRSLLAEAHGVDDVGRRIEDVKRHAAELDRGVSI